MKLDRTVSGRQKTGRPVPFWRRRDRQSRRKLNLASPVCLILLAAGYLGSGAPALPDGYEYELTRRLLELEDMILRRRRQLKLSSDQCARLIREFLASELEPLESAVRIG